MHSAPPSKLLAFATYALALLATLALELARHDHAQVPWVGWLGTGLTLVAVAAVRMWLARRPTLLPSTVVAAGLTTALLVGIPFLSEGLLRHWRIAGESPEIVQLLALRNGMLGLTLAPSWPGMLQLSCLLSVLVALGAMMFHLNWPGYVVSAGYGIVAIWWLMVAHWERMQGRFAMQPHRRMPLVPCTVSFALVLAGVGLAIAALGGFAATARWDGWFYGSGGSRYADLFAAHGVGLGERLIAARERAASFGAVESELFLDSEMPSLYDLFNDMYGEPLRPQQAERAVGLIATPQQPPERPLGESRQSGQEFSTLRHPPSRKQMPPKQESTGRALLYLAGRVPLHLRLETFDAFDGRTWTHAHPIPDRPRPQLRLQSEAEKPWLQLVRRGESPALCRAERHVLRVIRLRGNRIPTPAHLTGVHIDKVDQPDFYGWTDDDVLWMPVREQIPPLQVIHLRSRSIDDEALRRSGQGPALAAEHALTRPPTPRLAEIAALARAWTRHVPSGYPQVAAIVARLRGGSYVLDPAASPPPECPDSAAYFLLESRRGPDYLFATSAVLLLRTLGIPSRLCTGLYARPARYDRLARQTAILPEDVHCWVEVCLDGHTWITVEPTPGYEVLPPRRTWWEQAAQVGAKAIRRLRQHPLACGLLAIAALGSLSFRRELADLACTGVWQLSGWGSWRRRVLATLWLLERRAALAGRARPPHATLPGWYRPLARAALHRPPAALETLLTTAACLLYAAPDKARELDRSAGQIDLACREVVRRLTLQALRRTRAARVTRGRLGRLGLSQGREANGKPVCS